MKAIVLVLVVVRVFAAPTPDQPLVSNIPDTRFISSVSAEKFCPTIVKFECSLKGQIQKLYDTLKKNKAPVPELTIVSEGLSGANCDLKFKNSYQLDLKPKTVDEFKSLISKSFDQLLDALITMGIATEFEVKADSFIFDPKQNSILFVGLDKLATIGTNSIKLSNEIFKKNMQEKLALELQTFEISKLNLDFEMDNFKVIQDGFFENSLVDVFKKIDKTASTENVQEKTTENGKQVEEFPRKFDIMNLIDEQNFILTLFFFQVTDSYNFDKNNEFFSIYICQNEENIGDTECICLKEQENTSPTFWKMKMKEGLRYDIVIKEVETLQSFIKARYFKVFVILSKYFSRGIITNTHSRYSYPFNDRLSLQFYLRDDGSERIEFIQKSSSKVLEIMKMKHLPLDVGSSSEIQINRLTDKEAVDAKISVENPKANYYELRLEKNKTLIVRDEKGNKHPLIYYKDTQLQNFPLFKVCYSTIAVMYEGDPKNKNVLIIHDKKIIFKKPVKIYGGKDSNIELKKCINPDNDGKSPYGYEFDGQDESMDLRWNFNTKYEKDLKNLNFIQMFLTKKTEVQVPNFHFKKLFYPEFSQYLVLFSIAKLPNEQKFLLQGVYFERLKTEGIIIHPEKKPIIVDSIPQFVTFDKEYRFMSKNTEDRDLTEEIVNYLNDDEIVYNLDNKCPRDYTPTIEISKNHTILINCKWTKISLFGSDDIKKNKAKLSKGLNVVIEEIRTETIKVI